MVDNKSIIPRLMALGLTEYEAKAYLTLLDAYPATADEVARASGIPTSKVYSVLDRLVEKEAVTPVGEGKTPRYAPLAPKELLGRYRASMTKVVDSLDQDLVSRGAGRGLSYVWNITGYEHLMDRACRMIAEAKKTLLVSAWKDDFRGLEPSLREALRRKVRLAAIHFGVADSALRQLYEHPIEDTLYQEKGGRVLVIVADSREVLIGTVFGDERAEGAWSGNRGVVALAEDYIKHDIYIMKIVRRFDKSLIRKFGERYAKLRDIFNDEEEA
jgi:sugar-specific transcriptional regulator TrmB